MFVEKAEEYAKIVLEESHKMSYDDFCQEQISRKGYVCPANIWNPDLYEKSAVEICPDCEHYNNDCIVYGKKKEKESMCKFWDLVTGENNIWKDGGENQDDKI